ncbi:MAG: hypothetical protein WC767_01040 [Candidatus Paceibacterota bacterium]|jgi:hypothetical protein
MFKGNKTVLAIAILALIVAIIGVWPSGAGNGDLVMATPGTQLPIEQYVPAVLYNGGIYSTLPIQTTSTVTGDSVTVGSSGITVGSSGTAITQVLKGTCTLLANVSIAATSTGFADCAVTGVQSGDNVFVSLSTTTTAIGNNWVVAGTKASTTAGFISVKLLNLTGTTAVPAATSGFGSSTSYLIVR